MHEHTDNFYDKRIKSCLDPFGDSRSLHPVTYIFREPIFENRISNPIGYFSEISSAYTIQNPCGEQILYDA